ncbi:MAG: hypothetical protein PF636_10020 [Actinomycetota bacterium]|jgi:hypothetical protein|nr:hypothetical protein [Actinomycetota bacterium]
MHRHHACCGHGRTEPVTYDPRSVDDEFMQAAARESSEHRALAAHAHAASLFVTIAAGLLFFGVTRKYFGRAR